MDVWNHSGGRLQLQLLAFPTTFAAVGPPPFRVFGKLTMLPCPRSMGIKPLGIAGLAAGLRFRGMICTFALPCRPCMAQVHEHDEHDEADTNSLHICQIEFYYLLLIGAGVKGIEGGKGLDGKSPKLSLHTYSSFSK